MVKGHFIYIIMDVLCSDEKVRSHVKHNRILCKEEPTYEEILEESALDKMYIGENIKPVEVKQAVFKVYALTGYKMMDLVKEYNIKLQDLETLNYCIKENNK